MRGVENKLEDSPRMDQLLCYLVHGTKISPYLGAESGKSCEIKMNAILPWKESARRL